MIRLIFLTIILLTPTTSEAAEWWIGGSPLLWTGDKHDTICDDDICREVDSRINHVLEMTLLSGTDDDNVRSYFMAGYVRGMDSKGDGSYTFVGGGSLLRPFSDNGPRFLIQIGIEFGELTLHHSNELRFRLGLYYAPQSEREYVPDLIGFCHRSTGRWFANLGSEERNDAINGVCLSYRVVH